MRIRRAGKFEDAVKTLLLIAVLVAPVCTSWADTVTVPNPGYRLGSNDVIRVQVFGEDDLTIEGKVGGDGRMTFPLVGPLQVVGRTAQEVGDDFTAKLAAGYLRQPKVTVSIIRYRNFYISGEVKTPGAYPYEDGLTVQKAVSWAGGLTEKADKAGMTVIRVNENKLDTLPVELDALIRPDDVIIVAHAQKIYVSGEVKTPGGFPYEKGLTMHKAITLAGGFTDKAAERRTKVLRTINGEQQSIRVKLDDPVLPEDIIVVPQSFF
jgi:polysaccharide export outer membrane protein